MLNGCKTGEAKITRGYNLTARHVIHAVGPVWRGGNNNERKLLHNAYTNSMLLAAANNARVLAFPNISTGVYHFPKDEAATIAIDAVRAFTTKHAQAFDKIIFACFDEENYTRYSELLNQ
jgi:O-acetyl-ADP-ribose deacetylase (regulator of RNase III)